MSPVSPVFHTEVTVLLTIYQGVNITYFVLNKLQRSARNVFSYRLGNDENLI